MPKAIVVNAEGILMKPPRPPPRPVFARKKPIPREGVTLKNLASLEDAIYADGPVTRTQFLKIYKEYHYQDLRKEMNEKGRLILTKRNTRALRYCWVSLGWRPNNNATKVTKNPHLKIN